jgi:filamentous hemagglutinin family protein
MFKIKSRILQFLLTILCLTAFNVGSLQAQTTITPNPSFTSVTNPAAGVYNIQATGASIPVGSSQTAIMNRYSQFTVGPNDTANVLLNGANTSINIVDGPISSSIAGTINSRVGGAGSSIGGNFIFVNPNGIMVMPGGSINAGSILLTTSSHTMFPLNSGTYSYADLNDASHVSRLVSQGINPEGIFRFTDPQSGISIGGFLTTVGSNQFIANESGVFMFGQYISIGSSGIISVPEGDSVAGFTGKELDWNSRTGEVNNKTPLPAGTSSAVWMDGTINAPSGTVLFEAYTEDIFTNMINLTGVINASAISRGADAGSVTLVTKQSGGSIDFDGGSGNGNILADSVGSGAAGTVDITTSSFRIFNGGYVSAINGSGSDAGGNFYLTLQPSSGRVTVESSGTVDPDSLEYIFLADTVLNPNARGNLYLASAGGVPGIEFNDSVDFNNGTNLFVNASEGDVCFNALVRVNGDARVVGDTINVNGSLQTLSSDIILLSRDGIINISSSGNLISSSDGIIALLRYGSNGGLTITSSGVISAGQGHNNLYIGNYSDINFTNGDIVLSGSTFGNHAGTYKHNETISINTSQTPHLLANEMVINNDTPEPHPDPDPDPHPDPDSDVKEEAKTDIQGAANDLENYEIVWDSYNKTLKLIKSIEEDPDLADITAEELEALAEIISYLYEDSITDLISLFDVCSGGSCNAYLEDSTGSMIVETLFNGYPSEVEYEADEYGLLYVLNTEYHPSGLVGFLTTIDHIENLSTSTSSGANNLLHYKHPPTDTRIDQLKVQLDKSNASEKESKVTNKRRYKALQNILN